MAVYADLLRYRDLFESLFRRDFQARYKGSAFGVLWSLANPLLLMAVYVVVFSVLLRVGSSLHDYALYVLVGRRRLGVLLDLADARVALDARLRAADPEDAVPAPARRPLGGGDAARHVRGDARRAARPLGRARAGGARHVLARGAARASRSSRSPPGSSLALASLNVVYRDVEHLVGAILLPWFFVTPVLYSFEQIPGAAEHETLVDVLRWGNPVTPPIEALRAPLWEGTLPSLADTIYLVVVSLASLALGAWVFGRVDDRIAAEL